MIIKGELLLIRKMGFSRSTLYNCIVNKEPERVQELLLDPVKSKSSRYFPFCGMPPLIIVAVKSGSPSIVRILLDEGYSPCTHDEKGWTPLHHAVALGFIEIIQILLEYGVYSDFAPSFFRKCTPLHVAAEKGGIRELDILLPKVSCGSSYQSQDFMGYTPLMCACAFGHESVITKLLNKGSNPFPTSNTGETAFSLLCQYSAINGDLIRAFLGNIGESHKKKYLVNEMFKMGERPIHCLIRSRSRSKVEAVRALLAHQVSLSSENWTRHTPLTLSCSLGDYDCTRLLLTSGCSPDAFDSANRNPLTIAAEKKDYKILKLLIHSGANVRLLFYHKPSRTQVPEDVMSWVKKESNVLRPLTYWARISLLKYNRDYLKQDSWSKLRIPPSLSSYIARLEDD